MSEPPRPDHVGRKESAEETIQFVSDDFESAWKRLRHGDPPPTIDAYLVGIPEPLRSMVRPTLEEVERRYQEQPQEGQAAQDSKAPEGERSVPPEDTQSRPETSIGAATREPRETAATVDFAPEDADDGDAVVPLHAEDTQSLPHTPTDDPLPQPGETAATVDFVSEDAYDGHAAKRARRADFPVIPGYDILGELGRGGMGVVYRARQKGLKRTVAVKMILAGGHAGPSELSRFHTEAEAVAQLQHPNIVQIHDVGEHGGMPFFSLEFVDGGSLSEALADRPMEAPRAAVLMETLARAMHYAHQHSIIHRDLKPANVLLTSDGVPKITDFGLAKRLEDDSSQTKSGEVMGTPSFMAPEQARADLKQIGPLSDVYALGALLYRLLTGQAPFVAANLIETLRQVLEKEPVPPTQLQPKIPLDLETICLKCLQKEPHKRYEDAEGLAEDLRRFSAGEPILARRISSGERIWRWCRRNPRMAALTGIAAALTLTVVIGSPIAVVRINQARLAAVDAKGEADRNAAMALQSEKVAQEAEQVAAQKAKVATEQAALALDAYQTLIGEVHGELAGRPEMQDLKQSLLTIAVEKLTKVARDVGNANLIDKEMARAHQRMGRLFEDLGQTSLALERHQKTHEIIEALALETPNDPIATNRNPAATRNKLGDMYVRLGDPAKARQYYQTALELRMEWSQSAPDELAAQLAVANSFGLLGGIDLMLGDPVAAREDFLKSLEWRERMPDSVNRKVEIRRQWAGLYDRLGDTSFKLGDGADAEEQYTRAREIRQRLMESRTKAVWHKQDVVISYLNLGDLKYRSFNDLNSAEAFYQKALQYTEELKSSDPRSAFPRRALSMVDYRLGTVSLALGKHQEATEYYKKCLEQREALTEESPEDIGAQIDLMLALARCGRHETAASLAAGFRENVPTSPWLLYQIGCGYSVCAAAVSDIAGLEASTNPDGTG